MQMETMCLLYRFISKSIQDTVCITGIQWKVLKIYYQLFHYKGCLQSSRWLPFPRRHLQTLASHSTLSRTPALPTLLRLGLLKDQMRICLWRCSRKKTVSYYIKGKRLPIFLPLAILSFYFIVKGPFFQESISSSATLSPCLPSPIPILLK